MRSPDRFVPTSLARVLIATARGAARERPPMIGPKGGRATIGAPGTPTLWQLGTAPAASRSASVGKIALRE
jgi:hypothetical protein